MMLEETVKKFEKENYMNPTAFNRYPYVFELIRKIISESEKPISIASIGCSQGQETYTLLFDNWDKQDKFSLTGYDIAEPNIIYARKGTYNALTPTETNYLKKTGLENESFKFLDKNTIQIKDSLKHKILFYKQDISKDTLSKPVDMVVMINVLCHYSLFGKHVIMENVIKSLNLRGIFIGRDLSQYKESNHLVFMNNLVSKGLLPIGDKYGTQSQIYQKI